MKSFLGSVVLCGGLFTLLACGTENPEGDGRSQSPEADAGIPPEVLAILSQFTDLTAVPAPDAGGDGENAQGEPGELGGATSGAGPVQSPASDDEAFPGAVTEQDGGPSGGSGGPGAGGSGAGANVAGSGVPGTSVPGSSGPALSASTGGAGAGGAGVDPEPLPELDCQSNIVFEDERLEHTVRTALGKDEGTLTAADVQNMTDMGPYSLNEVHSLEGIQCLVHLKELDLGWNEGVRDVSPIAALSELELLDLSRCNVSDLTPLSGLSHLRQLDLWENPITTLEPLRDLDALEYLTLFEVTTLTDLSPLCDLDSLRSIDMRQMLLTDISTLENCKTVEAINLYQNLITDISVLEGMPQLTNVSVGSNELTDISALAALQAPQSVTVSFNEVSDLSPLAGKSTMTNLFIIATPIDDISVVAGMPELYQLEAKRTLITSLEPVMQLKNLEYLDVTEAPIDCVGQADNIALLSARLTEFEHDCPLVVE